MRSSLARWDDSRGTPRPPEDNVFGSLSPERAKVLLFVAARASSFTMVVIVVLVLGTLLAAGSGMTGASGAIAAGWLAVHQVPLVIGKTSLSLLPLVPTAVITWLTARDCARAVEPRAPRVDLAWIAGAALAGPLLITAVCLAVAEDASAVVALQPPQTLVAFGWVGGLHLAAAVAGMVTRLYAVPPWRDLVTDRLPAWVLPGARAALHALRRLLLAGVVATVVAFLLHWSRIGETYRAAGDLGGVLGLTVLSLIYLPNVAIAATSVLVGADVHIGGGSLSLFSVAGARVPALPILAAVPTGPAAGWWPVLLLVPAAVGALAGVECGRAVDSPRTPWATLTAAGVVAVALTVFGLLAGGAVGSFGDIGPGVLLTALLAFGWLAVAGFAGLLAARWFLPVPVADEYAADAFDDDHEAPYDEYVAEGDYGDDYYRDDEYADEPGVDHDAHGYDYEYVDYTLDPDAADQVVDGELVEEPLALDATGAMAARTYLGDAEAEVVDAEVVEQDLPHGDQVDGR
ncbi:hypothetical protein GZH49_21490 [Nocardia terpenica]|uniref:cell division protein PerM n=1 Tax=Nocardia terpenica TaxID=455432 RepID=UPI002FE338E7